MVYNTSTTSWCSRLGAPRQLELLMSMALEILGFGLILSLVSLLCMILLEAVSNELTRVEEKFGTMSSEAELCWWLKVATHISVLICYFAFLVWLFNILFLN